MVLLRELALAMQDHRGGMRTEMSRREAAEALAGEWKSAQGDVDAIACAEAFLEEEELDSGIIVARGNNVRFWHRTFQEFLAARAIAARPEARQQELLWKPRPKLYLPEWREVMLLLAGILHQQGPEKVDNLVQMMLSKAGSDTTLAEQARCAGLLGAMLRDLAPVAYRAPDHQYEELLQRVLGIFDRERSRNVPIETRIEAADALGQAGDPRLDFGKDDYWVTIPGGEFWMGAQSQGKNARNYDPEATRG